MCILMLYDIMKKEKKKKKVKKKKQKMEKMGLFYNPSKINKLSAVLLNN